MNFFDQDDLDLLENWAGVDYDKSQLSHRNAGAQLRDVVWTKTAYWAERVKAQLDGFEIIDKRMWHQKGWTKAEPKRQIARFKEYTWARIFRQGDEKKHIFFTVGVNKNRSLVYKLDYYHEQDSELNARQKELCERLIPESLRWVAISEERLPFYDWTSLTTITKQFIEDFSDVYDEVVSNVWGTPRRITTHGLTISERPHCAGTPSRESLFIGFDTNWDDNAQRLAEIGIGGELLVIEHERQFLRANGHYKLAELVRKVKDGEGFDVESYFIDGRKRQIEVKTTTSISRNTAFMITDHEIQFSVRNKETFQLYRLYKFNAEAKSAYYYVIEGNLRTQLNLKPKVFEANPV